MKYKFRKENGRRDADIIGKEKRDCIREDTHKKSVLFGGRTTEVLPSLL